jgi:hypothetical protein
MKLIRFTMIAAAAGLFLGITPAKAANKCAPVSLALAGGPKPFTAKYSAKSPAFTQTSANFAKAYAKACAEGLLKKKALIDPKAKDKTHLFLYNAPESNIVSIYLDDGRRMLLEWGFVTDFGKANVPSADDLHEAIYCAVHGASEKEKEESGRCLPD